MNNLETFLPLILLAVVFYLLILRPMKSRQKQFRALKEMQDAIVPGTQVMITSGIHGVVVAVQEETILLQIAPGTEITVQKAAVAAIDEGAETRAEEI